jgi:hypothetical protein
MTTVSRREGSPVEAAEEVDHSGEIYWRTRK